MGLVPFCIALFVGYFLLRFGMVSRGSLRLMIQSVGGLILTATLISSFVVLGWKGGVISLLLFWFAVTPLTEIPVRWIRAKINAPYREAHEHLAEHDGTSPEEVEKQVYRNLDRM
jgi:hypothetical protein